MKAVIFEAPADVAAPDIVKEGNRKNK